MSDPFIGQIIMFGGNFAPRSWALCDGTLLSISQNTALFSILGTTYGGDGRTTFGLPDLRGRSAMHAGQGPGLTNRRLGEKGGGETSTLVVNNLPAHGHPATLHAENKVGSVSNPTNNMLARGGDLDMYAPFDAAQNKALSAESVIVGNTGASTPFNNMDPYQVVNFIICLFGTYPSRN